MTDQPITTTTTVRVRDLSLLADIGINPDEVGRRQPLVISVALLLEIDAAHAIAETVDYRRIVTAAETLAHAHIPLIEAFAYRLAHEAAGWKNVIEARVEIAKPFALTRGTAGVEVIARRAGEAEQQGK